MVGPGHVSESRIRVSPQFPFHVSVIVLLVFHGLNTQSLSRFELLSTFVAAGASWLVTSKRNYIGRSG